MLLIVKIIGGGLLIAYIINLIFTEIGSENWRKLKQRKISKNKECVEYLLSSSLDVTHRISFMGALIIMLFLTIIFNLIKPCQNPQTLKGYFFISFLIIFFMIYKILAHYSYHYYVGKPIFDKFIK